MRIALFTGNYNCVVDGVSRTLHRLVRHLDERRHQTLAFGPKPRTEPISYPGTFVPIPSVPIPNRREYLLNIWLTPGARVRLDRFSPHLIHIATPDLLGLAALRYGRRNGLPVVSSFHTHFSSYLGYYHAGFLEPLFWYILRRFYNRCDQVYIPSLSMLVELQKRGFGNNLLIWERGVDKEIFNPRHRSLFWRRSLGIQDDEVVVLFVSRLVKEKGIDVLASVICTLQRRKVPHRTLIVGDGPERKRLEKILSETTFTGHLEDTELSRAYASADLFVFPSTSETFGNVTLEAFASGLPVVCVPATGNSNLLEGGDCGILAPREELADAIARLVFDSDLRARFGQAARRRAKNFTWKSAIDHLESYYKGLLKRWPAAS